MSRVDAADGWPKKNLIGSDSEPGGSFDSSPDSFGGESAGDRGFSHRGFSKPPHRRVKLLMPSLPTPPDFGELDTATAAFVQKDLSAPTLGVPALRELDITQTPDGLASAVPVFAQPPVFDATHRSELVADPASAAAFYFAVQNPQ